MHCTVTGRSCSRASSSGSPFFGRGAGGQLGLSLAMLAHSRNIAHRLPLLLFISDYPSHNFVLSTPALAASSDNILINCARPTTYQNSHCKLCLGAVPCTTFVQDRCTALSLVDRAAEHRAPDPHFLGGGRGGSSVSLSRCSPTHATSPTDCPCCCSFQTTPLGHRATCGRRRCRSLFRAARAGSRVACSSRMMMMVNTRRYRPFPRDRSICTYHQSQEDLRSNPPGLITRMSPFVYYIPSLPLL